MRRSIPLLLAFLTPIAVGGAATQSAPVHETAEVSLVDVPVNVVGRDGKPVRNLKASDFTLEDDGKRQTILSVDTFDLSSVRGVGAPDQPLPAGGRRHFLLLFDFSFATPQEIVRSREAALKFVGSVMAPEDLAAVATISVENGAKLLLNFTEDRRQLSAVVRTIGLPGLVDKARDPLAFAFVLPGDPHLADLVPAEALRSGNEAEIQSNVKVLSNLAQKTADEYAEERIERHLLDLSGLARALDIVDGRKTILYFSEGFDGRLLLGNMVRPSDKNIADSDAMYRGQYWALDVDKRFTNTTLQRFMGDTLAFFRRSDCAVYPIDIAGLRVSGDEDLAPAMQGEESLFQIANETGGEVLHSGNDIDDQLRRILERTSVTYVLTFQPTQRVGNDKFHELKIRVDVPHARVSARAGYFESRSFEAMSPLQRVFSAAGILTSDQESGSIPIRVAALPLSRGEISSVPVLVTVPPGFFSNAADEGQLTLGVYAYVSDSNGTVADYFTRNIALDLAQQKAKLAQGGLTYYSLCHLLPGDYVVRILVRDERTGRYGFHSEPVRVPDYRAAALEVLPPVFLEEPTRGLNLRDTSGDNSTRGLFSIGDEQFAPSIGPRLAANSHTRLCLMIVSKPSAGGVSPFQLRAEFVGGGASAPVPAQVRLLSRTDPDASGMLKLLVDVDTSGLESGSYEIRFTVQPDGDSASIRAESPFQIS